MKLEDILASMNPLRYRKGAGKVYRICYCGKQFQYDDRGREAMRGCCVMCERDLEPRGVEIGGNR